MNKNIILFIHKVDAKFLEELKVSSKKLGYAWRFMLLRDASLKNTPGDEIKGFDVVAMADFKKGEKIAEALFPYRNELLAVTSRGEANIARFAKVIPHVPYLRTSSVDSISWSVDKLKMRRRLKLFDAKKTPRFTKIIGNTVAERARIKEKIGFPLIVKPTNLSTSLLVSICYHEEELNNTLRTAFRKINKIYADNGRSEEPVLIAEEFMDGSMYSIDSYVDSRGRTYHCPLVSIKTGKNIGHDDFYNYLRVTPVDLKPESVRKAEEAAEVAIHALGLRSTTTHTELMRVDNDWMIIEIGARIGGFRNELYKASCDIDHNLNDVLIRIPKKPILPKKCKGYAAVMKYYANKEGRIETIKGIKKIQEIESVTAVTQTLHVGGMAKFSKNGGKGVFTASFYNDDRSKLLADIRRVEKLIAVKVASRSGSKK